MFGLEIKYSLAKKSARNKMQSRFFYNNFFPFAFYSFFAIIYFVVLYFPQQTNTLFLCIRLILLYFFTET